MSYPYIAAAAFAVYYFRRYWLTPWARFESYSKCSKGWFLTVKHVAWYPPFLDRKATYFRTRDEYTQWAEVTTGWAPWGGKSRNEFGQLKLDGILQSAIARDIETEELSK